MIGYKLQKLNMCKHNFYNNMALNLFWVNLRISNSLVLNLLNHKHTSVNHSFSQISHFFRNIYFENKIVYLEEGKSRKQNLKVDDAFLHLAEEGYTRVNDVSQIMQPIRFEITKMCCFDDMK